MVKRIELALVSAFHPKLRNHLLHKQAIPRTLHNEPRLPHPSHDLGAPPLIEAADAAELTELPEGFEEVVGGAGTLRRRKIAEPKEQRWRRQRQRGAKRCGQWLLKTWRQGVRRLRRRRQIGQVHQIEVIGPRVQNLETLRLQLLLTICLYI